MTRARTVTRADGNIFRDLGFPPKEAASLLIRSDLMIGVRRAIMARGLTQAAAARLLGVHPPRISDLMRSRIDLFSIETLIDMLGKLGVGVEVQIRPTKRKA